MDNRYFFEDFTNKKVDKLVNSNSLVDYIERYVKLYQEDDERWHADRHFFIKYLNSILSSEFSDVIKSIQLPKWIKTNLKNKVDSIMLSGDVVLFYQNDMHKIIPMPTEDELLSQFKYKNEIQRSIIKLMCADSSFYNELLMSYCFNQ